MRTAVSSPSSNECVRVLLVDDNVRDARTARAFLHAEGTQAAEIVHVRTLHGAVDALRRKTTDVVLTSPRLPDAAGAGIVERLLEVGEDVPVIVLASPLDVLPAHDSLRLGAHDHLVKGVFDAPILWRSIRHARDRRRLAGEIDSARAGMVSAQAAVVEVLEADDAGVVVVADDGCVRYANRRAATLYGALPPAIVGTLFPHALVPGSRFDLELARAGAEPLPLSATAFEMRWDGAPAYLVRLREPEAANGVDDRPERSERSKLEAVGRLATGIAHDVDNLLTALHVATNLAAERLAGEGAGREEAVARRLASIDACAHRAAVLVRQLLAVGRRRAAAPAPFDVHRLLDAMRPILRSALGDAVRVTLMPRARRSWVCADAGTLEDAILDLALHAHAAMGGEGGAWLVETEDVELDATDAGQCGVAAGRYVRLSFSDTSPGVDVERLPRLFDPRSGAYGPTPGLAEAGAIVRAASGALEVESAPGAGTTFRMLLPETQAPAVADGALHVATLPRRVPPASATILLVEDMPELREIARDSLTEAGYRVIDACSGDEGLQSFVESPVPVDLVVTDVVMPGSSGPAMVRALRERKPELRALFMSSRSGDDLAHLWRVSPNDPCLEKPFRKSDLLEKVAEALCAGPALADAARTG